MHRSIQSKQTRTGPDWLLVRGTRDSLSHTAETFCTKSRARASVYKDMKLISNGHQRAVPYSKWRLSSRSSSSCQASNRGKILPRNREQSAACFVER